jgi:P27 family predicted phage terminase small subunit
MASVGRKPKPTHLKLLAGNPGHRPLNTEEPIPEGDLASPPDWMTESQKEVWSAALESAPKNLLRRLDSSIFQVWVVACDAHKDAAVKVSQSGMVVKSPVKGEPMQNPYVSIMNRQAMIMMKAAAEMGFTPSSRSRIRIKNELPGNSSKFQQFIE